MQSISVVWWGKAARALPERSSAAEKLKRTIASGHVAYLDAFADDMKIMKILRV